MINIISSTIRLINKRYYKKLFLIQILIIFSSIIDLAGFAAIIPFFALVSDPSMVNREGIFMYLYKISGADNANEFIILFGGFLIFTFILRSFISSIRIWFSTYFANIVGFGIGDSLYQYYITRDLPFHIANSNSYLIKQITIEAIRVKNILKAFMQMNSNIITAIFIISIMIIYNPFVTVASSIIIASAYLLVNKKVNSTLINNGQVITESSKERLKILSNGFGSIKEIAMMSKEKYFFKKMKKTSLALARGTTINQVIPQVTNLFFQLIMFGGIISALLYLLSLHENDVRNVIPIFSAYALAAYKIIPAFQMVFKGLTEIKSNLPALKSIESDIKDMKSSIISNHNYQDYNKIEKDSAVFNSFELKDVYYRYGEKKTDVLKRINLKVKSGEKIGLVGESGAGKTTLINIISTLLNPSRGELLFNNNLLKNVEKSRPIRIGMVSQDVFLLNGTIIENIAFGVPEKLIDINKVKECINSSNLSRLIASLEKGIYSEVGERGVELSGGQRQRIGLARALYNNDDLLILDEATSALDGVTEKEVIDTIMEDASCTVVIIAHRIHTLKQCNKIYIMSSGEFIESGNYNELKEKSHHFRELGYLT